jgi:hypothetical protein
MRDDEVRVGKSIKGWMGYDASPQPIALGKMAVN